MPFGQLAAAIAAGVYFAASVSLHICFGFKSHVELGSGERFATKVVSGFRPEGRKKMLETQVIGNKDWAMGVLTEADIRCLESFDCEMRIRYLQQKEGSRKTKTYEQLVEEHGHKVPTHCEHGIPLYRK